MITELRQPLWMSTPYGEGLAILLTDYGPESDHLWTCIQQEGEHTGELWTWHNSDVRVLANRSLLRGRPSTEGVGPPVPQVKLNIPPEELERHKGLWEKAQPVAVEPVYTFMSESEVNRRADNVVEELWAGFRNYYTKVVRPPDIKLSKADFMAFREVAQPLLRALARPPKTT